MSNSNTLIEQSDKDPVIEQSHQNALYVPVVLLEQCVKKKGSKLVREENGL